jgi:hypothetical protein
MIIFMRCAGGQIMLPVINFIEIGVVVRVQQFCQRRMTLFIIREHWLPSFLNRTDEWA